MKSLLPAAATVLLLASACAGSSGASATGPGTVPTAAPAATPTVPACPSAVPSSFRWPAGVPADLPKPPSSTYLSATTSADGVTIVKLTSALSLQQSVLFVIKSIQAAGYTLGRGDAEPAEADAPFGKDTVRGLYKMLVRSSCSTDWLIATAHLSPSGGSPVLPTHSAGPNASPLPFG